MFLILFLFCNRFQSRTLSDFQPLSFYLFFYLSISISISIALWYEKQMLLSLDNI